MRQLYLIAMHERPNGGTTSKVHDTGPRLTCDEAPLKARTHSVFDVKEGRRKGSGKAQAILMLGNDAQQVMKWATNLVRE